MLWVLMHVKGTLPFEWNLSVWNCLFSSLFFPQRNFKINTENQTRLFWGDQIASFIWFGYCWLIQSPRNFYWLDIVLVGSDSSSISHFNYGKKIIKMQLMWLNSWVWTWKKRRKVNFNEFWDQKDTSGGWICQDFNLRMCWKMLWIM